MTLDHDAVPRQFRHWLLHCGLNALPSFIIALAWCDLWRYPSAIFAMLSAIACFVILYTVLGSLRGPLSQPDHILARSLKLGTRIRAVVTLCSLPALATEGTLFFTPDLWCGMLATAGVNGTMQALGHQGGALSEGSFATVFAITLLEGFILSFLLFMISFFALVFIQIRDRRKAFAPNH
ncbi:MAG: hypothetical protein EAZ65_02040 [Verrucomicrobia bacterium]|nr:MAG: hypothetical protein EAZ84_13075 [Verrucomicrobiota bacterium]TAE88952.1 MAG: hypothetical protein EAZ82_02690 [Verrucomicrobiota bacterium]TAF27368.1 MAG: hypothetical protein EAZ71_02650 [Verrucomicrobiota bacterium]TAF42341.1 MAG: hypothetical protein EAZ65_02040 [Verrucomicrobiota bacterium]